MRIALPRAPETLAENGVVSGFVKDRAVISRTNAHGLLQVPANLLDFERTFELSTVYELFVGVVCHKTRYVWCLPIPLLVFKCSMYGRGSTVRGSVSSISTVIPISLLKPFLSVRVTLGARKLDKPSAISEIRYMGFQIVCHVFVRCILASMRYSREE